MRQAELIFEDQSLYDWWLKLTLGGVLVLTVALGLAFLYLDRAASAVMFGITAFDGLLFYFIIPRRYLVYTDKLIIQLGGPFSMTIKLTDIKSAERVVGYQAMASSGVRFATSTRFVVGINRYRGMNLIISPSQGDLFLEQLNRAILDKRKR